MEKGSPHRHLKPWELLLLGLLGLAVVAGAVAVSAYFITHKPKPQRKRPPEMAPLVEVQTMQPSREQVLIDAQGVVIPAMKVTLQARVSGEITKTHPEFMEGGIVEEGETLVGIDARDYELALVSKEAQLESARYEISVEQGRQDVAKREWELLDLANKAGEADYDLALRKPHLRRNQANLEAAEAAVDQAKLDLERTVVKAPFNAIILSSDVDVGDQATPQKQLGTLAGTDSYWVQVSVRVDQLQWLDLTTSEGASAVSARILTGTGAIREGHVVKLVGDLEPKGRLARLLVAVDDPLNLKNPQALSNRLLLGDYVRVELDGKLVDDVYSVPFHAVHDGSRVWLVNAEGRLSIRDAEIVWSDEHKALLRGIEPGARLVTSDIAAPVDGMKLRIKGMPEPESGAKPDARPDESEREGATNGQ